MLREFQVAALTKPELTGEWEFKLRQMEHGQLSRAAFMNEIRALTTDIVEKVAGGLGARDHRQIRSLKVKCPRCGTMEFKETFRAFECVNPECKLIVWKTMADREFEREEVEKLLTTAGVGPLRGFRSKFGKPFSAVVTRRRRTRWKQRFDFENDRDVGENGEAAVPVNPEPLGVCRVCQTGQVFEFTNAYTCSNVPLQKVHVPPRQNDSLKRTSPRAGDQGAADRQDGPAPAFHLHENQTRLRRLSQAGPGGKVGFRVRAHGRKKRGKPP
jgi:DNA topoisomerase-3